MLLATVLPVRCAKSGGPAQESGPREGVRTRRLEAAVLVGELKAVTGAPSKLLLREERSTCGWTMTVGLLEAW